MSKIEAAILEGRLFVFFSFVLVSNHYFTIVLFLWGSSTHNTHINKSGQDSHNKTFSELHQSFDPDLRLARIDYFTI